MKIVPKQIDRLILRAQRLWGLEDWTIEWQFGQCEFEGDIEIRFTEKYALVTLDKSKIVDRQNLVRTIYHEVGHCLIEILDRNLSDFVEHYIKNPKTKKIFWERLNTDENVILDHLICRVFKL